MIEIKLPPKPVYNTLYGIDEKYHNEVEYIKGLEMSPLFQDVQNLNKYNGLLNEYTRKNKRLGRLKRLRESCKEEITHWWHYGFYALCSLLAFMGTGPLFAFVLFVFSLFGVELNLPEHFAVYLFFFPAGCVIVYFIGIVIAWVYSQITIRFLDRKINDKELQNKVLGGDVVSKKVALEILRIREDERFAKEKERFDVEVEKMEQKYPGIKATEGSCSLYSRNVFKRESEGFVKALKDLIKRCNQLYTKQWWETMTPFDFENEVAKWFVQKGYNAITTQHSADGGVDIVLEKDGVKEYVQCKHYMNQTISVATVRELFGVMASDNIKSGYIVSLYGMTQGAAEFAYKNNIKSITLEQLSEKPDKIVYDDKVVYTGYHDTVLNQSCVGISVGDCFIYEDVFDDSRLAQESLKKRIVPKDRWLFVLSTNGRYYSNGYYAVVSCPILMKNDIQNTGKVLGI
jgi:hypothetical protein